MTERQKITPCLWFDRNGEEAVRFYTSLIPGSSIEDIHHARSDTPGNTEGEVLVIKFTLAGQPYMVLNSGRRETFNETISLSVDCADQAEVDRYWEALIANGGQPIACGWVKDRYGLSWQIIPRRLPELLADPDKAKGKRVMHAMMEMVKLDVAALEAAARGE